MYMFFFTKRKKCSSFIQSFLNGIHYPSRDNTCFLLFYLQFLRCLKTWDQPEKSQKWSTVFHRMWSKLEPLVLLVDVKDG